MDIEDTTHIFINFSFTKTVSRKIKHIKKITQNWRGNDLNECLENWIADKRDSPSIASYICWYTWLERNTTLFEGKEPSNTVVVIKTLGIYQKLVIKLKIPPARSCWIEDTLEFPVAFFDGVA
jgi:hypothetical protein